jgi:hypothetical protein
MPYYRINFIEGAGPDGGFRVEPRSKRVLAWARIEERADGTFLVYRTLKDFSLPAAERRILGRPRIFPNGFLVEVGERGWRLMLRFTEYHGRRVSRGNVVGTPFLPIREVSRPAAADAESATPRHRGSAMGGVRNRGRVSLVDAR